MDYVTASDLRDRPNEIWQRVEAGKDLVITRNGKPFALLVHTEPQAVEDTLRAVRLARFGEAVRRIRADAAASGAAQLGDADIQAEIDAVRRERKIAP